MYLLQKTRPTSQCFPEVRNAIVIFGAGYGWEALASARWLHQCRLHYWGISIHMGLPFSTNCGHFPHVESLLLMDRETLLAHKNVWGRRKHPIAANSLA